MTKLNHPEFATEDAFHERLNALPAHTVYAQLTGNEDWGSKMLKHIPEHMRDGLVRYIAIGHRSNNGQFLQAVMNNDLMGAFRRADDVNTRCMWDWCHFLYNFAPAGCYGHPNAYNEWEGLLAQYVVEED